MQWDEQACLGQVSIKFKAKFIMKHFQVLRGADHPICVRVLQSVWPKLHRGRPLPLFCRSREQRLQLHRKTLLWHPDGQVWCHPRTFKCYYFLNLSFNHSSSGQATEQQWEWRWFSWLPLYPPSQPPPSLARWDSRSVTFMKMEGFHFHIFGVNMWTCVPGWLHNLDLGDLRNISWNLLNAACSHNADLWTQVRIFSQSDRRSN